MSFKCNFQTFFATRIPTDAFENCLEVRQFRKTDNAKPCNSDVHRDNTFSVYTHYSPSQRLTPEACSLFY